jgi:hypothetical protein
MQPPFLPMEQQLCLVAVRRINCREEFFVCYTGIRLEHMQLPFFPMEQQLHLVAARRINSGEEIFACYTEIRLKSTCSYHFWLWNNSCA